MSCQGFVICGELAVEVHITGHVILLALACRWVDVSALTSLRLPLVLEVAVLSTEVAHALGAVEPDGNGGVCFSESFVESVFLETMLTLRDSQILALLRHGIEGRHAWLGLGAHVLLQGRI